MQKKEKATNRIDANTTALLIRAALDIFFYQKSSFWGKYLITSNLQRSNLVYLVYRLLA